MIGIEEILTVFEEEDKENPTVYHKSAAIYDKVLAERGQAEAHKLWSRACHEYDRRHMTAEDYAANYPGSKE